MKRQRKLQIASKVKEIKPKRASHSLSALGLYSLMLFCNFSAVLIPSPDAATINANSCNTTDIQSAVNSAANQRRHYKCSGTGSGRTWTQTVTVGTSGAPKSLMIIGAGVGSTVISDNVAGPLFNIFAGLTPMLRLSGMTFQPAGSETASSASSILSILGTCAASGCTTMRLDHLAFTGAWAYPTNLKAPFVMAFNVLGLIDHINLTNNSLGTFIDSGFTNYEGVGNYGDNSWAQPDAWGTANALYIEDSTFTDSGAHNQMPITDCEIANNGAPRFVIRHCSITNGYPYNHGTDSTGRTRGGRSFEVYDNTLTCDENVGGGSNCVQGAAARSGTGFFFNNNMPTVPANTSNAWNSGVTLVEYRDADSLGGWGSCDGTGPWDQNDNVVYDSGKVTGSSGASSMTDSSKNWTTNQWIPTGAPYSLRNVTQAWGSEITGNTANTITVITPHYNTGAAWNPGDSYQILRAKACVDQPGRGQSVLLSGATPTPTGWIQNQLDPIYVWGITAPPNNFHFGLVSSGTGRVIADRDYYIQNSSFNGTSGVGSGLLSARPATCSAQVGYWATDTNTLYQCSGGSWKSYYTPYVYPHPLQGGTVPPPPPPPPTGGKSCDLNGDGSLNVLDVQLCVNQALGVKSCTTGDINGDGSCNVLDVQKVVNGALGGTCP